MLNFFDKIFILPTLPCALESYSFISRIFPLDTCQNKEYGLCISFILLYIRSLSHLNVEPHQRADLSSTQRSVLHLGGKSGSVEPLRLLPASHGWSEHFCRARCAVGPVAWKWGKNNIGEILGRTIAKKPWKRLRSSGNLEILRWLIPLFTAFTKLLKCFCGMPMK